MAIGAEALKVIGVSLKVTVAMRSPNVIDLCCDLNVAAESHSARRAVEHSRPAGRATSRQWREL